MKTAGVPSNMETLEGRRIVASFRKALRVLIGVALLLAAAGTSLARKPAGNSSSVGHSTSKSHGKTSSPSGKIHVRGYTRKDGTYVAPYERSAPGSGHASGRPSHGLTAPHLISPSLTTPHLTSPGNRGSSHPNLLPRHPAGRARPVQAQRVGKEPFQASSAVPGDWEEQRPLPGLRDRSHCPAVRERAGRAVQHAVADNGAGQAEGSLGAPRVPRVPKAIGQPSIEGPTQPNELHGTPRCR